jgi:hypothetical protein
MPRPRKTGEKPPELFCSHCEREVTNLIGGDSQYSVANCLTQPLVSDILEVSDYQSGIESGKNFYSEHADPPLYSSRRGKHKDLKDRAKKNLAKDASNVLTSWRVTADGSGIKEPSVAYIVTHLENLKLHLQAHFPALKPKFDEYADRVRDRNEARQGVDVAGDVAAQQEFARPPPPTQNVVALDYASDSDVPSSNNVVQFANAAGSSSDAAVDVDVVVTTRASSCDNADADYVDAVDDDSPISDYDTSFNDESDDEHVELDAYDDESCEDVDVPEYVPVRKQLTLRQVFEIIKATVPLNDSQCSKILTIFKNAFPEWRKKDPYMWKKYTTDGSLLAAPSPEYLKQKNIRKVVCGLTKEDYVPFHDPVKRERMLDLYEKTGSTIAVTEKSSMGDMVDFDVEKSLLMESPAALDPGAYIKLLEKVNAARPNLLSPDLLFIVDKAKYNDEQLKPNPERPKMNLFTLKIHSDGVQIAKNASLPECSPISFTIDRIYPFDPLTGARDDAKSLRIPSTMPAVHTISVYHGKGACCLFQYMEHMKREMCRLSPSLNIVKNNGDSDRKLVVEHLLTIADSVERCKRTGELIRTSWNYST